MFSRKRLYGITADFFSDPQALAKNFGVSAQIVDDLKLAPAPADAEDLAVGWSGLASRRDIEVSEPHDVTKWVSVTMRRNSIVSPTSPMLGNNGSTGSTSIVVWLPKDRQTLHDIVNAYFGRLNFHRPVFSRHSFDQKLAALYDGQAGQHDPGIVCSVYLVLALGTLSELNHRVHGMEKEGVSVNGSSPKTLLPAEWPGHEEFFSRALAVKPELRVTVSSLQALILLHWYLYTEVSVCASIIRSPLIRSAVSDKDEPCGA